MTIDHNALRPEASPIPYWKHHKRAKEALNFIIRVLNGAAGSVSGSKHVAGDPSIDTNRASRIVFISGEPGSGKSTLYLTLRAMLRSKEYSEGYDDEVLDALRKVRWLDALDLEVAGEEGENLLAAVLVRLFRELEKSESGPISSSKCQEAIKELEDLATDIGIAWEGNLRARAGALDPDTFSAEVIRTQGARLRINKRLEEALDKLAENECYGCDKNTLFVLPVDDFYLKPTASLQLLRLLRMISIPRLFFLVMGDINTVEALFIEKSLADWTEVSGTRLFAARSDRLDQALTRARELRARYLRKLLPPLQRADIEAMDWFEALDFELDHSNASADTLETLLDQVELDTPRGKSGKITETLHTFLISPERHSPSNQKSEWRAEKLKRENRAQGKAKENEEKEDKAERTRKKIQSAYTALQIMDATPREIMDLGFALREVIRRRKEEKAKKEKEYKKEDLGDEDYDQIPQLLLVVRNIVNLVREEQSFLNETEQNVLEGILPTRHYSPEDIIFNMDRLCLKPTERNWKERKSSVWKERKSSVRLWFRDHRSWDLSVNRKFISDSNDTETRPDEDECLKANKDPYAKLPPRQAAWYVLLHDLAWKWNRDCVTGNLVERLRKELEKTIWEQTVAPQVNLEQSFQGVAKEVMNKFLTLFERFVDQSNETDKAEQGGEIKAELEEEKQRPDPQNDFRGWAVYSPDGKIYKHFPLPEFETIRDLDRFLFVWSRGLEWLERSDKQAQQRAEETRREVDAAMTLAEEAKRHAEELREQAKKAGSENKDKAVSEEELLRAEASFAEKQANAVEAQRRADEAQDRVSESQQITRLIRLWSLAASTIIDEQYGEFARSGVNWFERGLQDLMVEREENQNSRGWRDYIEKFRLEMLRP